MILSLRTDNPDAEIGLYDGEKQLSYYKWHAARSLARELLQTLNDQLHRQQATWSDVSGIVVFQGPGSFTGLRIGLTVANTIAYGERIPIVAAQGDNWLSEGLQRLQNNEDDRMVLPHYGAEAHITPPKK